MSQSEKIKELEREIEILKLEKEVLELKREIEKLKWKPYTIPWTLSGSTNGSHYYDCSKDDSWKYPKVTCKKP